MNQINRKNTSFKNKLPIKIVQFGQGVFLRGFVDYAIQQLNKSAGFNAGVALVKPRENGSIQDFIDQDGLFTLFTKGVINDELIQEQEVIDVIQQITNPYTDFSSFLELARLDTLEFIFSNTTEAGVIYQASDRPDMQPPNSFPAKLTVFLFERFNYHKEDISKGVTIIPCELIENNGSTLKEIILKHIDVWNLGKAFKNWVENHNYFYNNLVDRIVPGYPTNENENYQKELGYKDQLMVVAEPYFLWAIEGDTNLKRKLPFHKTSLNVCIVDNIKPYSTRKVRILNGVHTSIFALSYLSGIKTVSETMGTYFTQNFIHKMVSEEIIPSIDGNKKELKEYANEIYDRFKNPFIEHALTSLSLNAISKFKVRVLPSLLEYVSIHNKLPTHLTFAFACLIQYYRGTWNHQNIPVNDTQDVIEAFEKSWASNNYALISESLLGNSNIWGQDLTKINNLSVAIAQALEEMENNKNIEIAFLNFKKRY